MSQIHQEVSLNAPPEDVYRALTDSKTFAAFTDAPAEISAEAGGEFTCFGPFILGRNVELVPNKRIVQDWRVMNWPDGHYSKVRFEIAAEGAGTKLTLDQDGVPEDEVGHVDGGWTHKYWEPLRQYLEK
ncbi:MAG: SRPBCC family protein [Planctomycetota bacterium]|jgi:activator of HSP90 ATPase